MGQSPNLVPISKHRGVAVISGPEGQTFKVAGIENGKVTRGCEWPSTF